MNTVEKVYSALLNGSSEIVLNEQVRQRVELALRNMMQLG